MEILNESIEMIIRDRKLLEKINEIGIKTIRELSAYSPRELEEKGIERFYVKDISIALQCNGLDLKKNKNRRK